MAVRRKTATALKLATFNVNGIRSRLPHLLQWLDEESPDIVCLQELKAIDEGFPIADIRKHPGDLTSRLDNAAAREHRAASIEVRRRLAEQWNLS